VDETPAPSDADAVSAWMRRNISWFVLVFGLTFFVLPHVSPFGTLNYYLSSPQRFSQWMLSKLENLFANYGYYVVFLGVFLENAMFLGFLVPGSVILILAGLSAQNGMINIWYVFALAVSATILGDTLSYLIGRMGWAKAIEKGAAGGVVERLRGAMEKNYVWIILGYHWAGYSRAVGPAAAGLFRIPYRRWAPLDYAGGAVWAIAYTMLGVLLGMLGLRFNDTKTLLRLLEFLFLGIFVAAILLAWYRTSRGKRPAPAAGQHPATVIVAVDDD